MRVSDALRQIAFATFHQRSVFSLSPLLVLRTRSVVRLRRPDDLTARLQRVLAVRVRFLRKLRVARHSLSPCPDQHELRGKGKRRALLRAQCCYLETKTKCC